MGLEVLALVGDLRARVAGPEQLEYLESLAQAVDSSPVDLDAERVELAGYRARSDAELDAPAGRVIKADDLTGEHGRVPEGIAQHEVANAQARGVRRDPRRRRHRVEHGMALGRRRREVVHEGDAAEPRGLSSLGPLDDGIHRHPQLGKEEVELHRHRFS